MAEQHLLLKPRHTLVGKGLLPMIIGFKNLSNDIPVADLGRLKKDHPLNNYSLDEIATEFNKITGESLKDVLQLAGKDVNLDNGLQLMHQTILYANLIGGPKGSSLNAPDQGASTSSSGVVRPATVTQTPGQSSVCTSSPTRSDIEDRLRQMENNFDSLKSQHISDKVSEALKNVRALAGRPKLTSPSVLIAALEFLVECAYKAAHPETDYYQKALQACRQFENHDDICNLCLKLLGSSEDKKISATIAEWQKNARKSEKNEDKANGNTCSNSNLASVHGLPPPCFPGLPYPPQFPYPFSGGYASAFPGFSVNGSAVPSYGGFISQRPAFRPRFGRKPRGACFKCRKFGHHADSCPEMKKE